MYIKIELNFNKYRSRSIKKSCMTKFYDNIISSITNLSMKDLVHTVGVNDFYLCEKDYKRLNNMEKRYLMKIHKFSKYSCSWHIFQYSPSIVEGTFISPGFCYISLEAYDRIKKYEKEIESNKV